MRPNLNQYFWRGEEKFNNPQRLEMDDATPAGDGEDEEQRVHALQMTIDETMRSQTLITPTDDCSHLESVNLEQICKAGHQDARSHLQALGREHS